VRWEKVRSRGDGERWELGERASVFDGCLGRSTSRVRPSTRCSHSATSRSRSREHSPTKAQTGSSTPDRSTSRCAAPATQRDQINHITSRSFRAASAVVEVHTAGNWRAIHRTARRGSPARGSYWKSLLLPHADRTAGCIRGASSTAPAWTDLTETVRADISSCRTATTRPRPHGYDLYYLNGPAGDRRSMAAGHDPLPRGIRSAWATRARSARSLVTLARTTALTAFALRTRRAATEPSEITSASCPTCPGRVRARSSL